jgi:hypothetical protein
MSPVTTGVRTKWRLLTLDLPVCSDAEYDWCVKGSWDLQRKMWVGARARQDKLLFTQLWGDSLSFDFESIGEVDVFWIDGAHDYMHVRHDTLSG